MLAWLALAGAIHLLTAESRAEASGEDPAGWAAGDPDAVQLGGELFQANCAACHGTRGEGGPGVDDLTAGPPLAEVDVAYSDMVMRTGRMPIESQAAGVYRDELEDGQREAIVAWMLERLEVPGELPEVGDGDAARGQQLYTRNCAACHGAGGVGGISGAGTTVPDISTLDPVAVFEGTRVGPFAMPAFGPRVLDDGQVEDIAAYLAAAEDAPTTLLGIHEVDEVTGGLLAGVLVLLIVVALLVTDRARRVSRHGGPGPSPGLPRDATPGDEVEP